MEGPGQVPGLSSGSWDTALAQGTAEWRGRGGLAGSPWGEGLEKFPDGGGLTCCDQCGMLQEAGRPAGRPPGNVGQRLSRAEVTQESPWEH